MKKLLLFLLLAFPASAGIPVNCPQGAVCPLTQFDAYGRPTGRMALFNNTGYPVICYIGRYEFHIRHATMSRWYPADYWGCQYE